MDKEQRKRKRAEEKSTRGASSSSSNSPEAPGLHSGQYDVFLNFRGSDTRKAFTDHLYHNLVKVGTVPFWVFRDENSIPIGEEFGLEILDAIKQSKISIPVISENYASSKWCLHELVHIMECKKSMSHIVLPIFYKVAPSDVRHLKGNFGNAFHLRRERYDEKDIQEWQRALNEVSYIHGWESDKFEDGHEGKLIEDVVRTVLSKLQEDFQLIAPKHLVGLDDCLKKIMNWIDSPSINARMIGIYGMGGIGKTTLAKIIHNKLLKMKKFDHVSFLPDVRETTKCRGITYLQSQLITDILQSKNEVSRIDDGINIIKSRFKRKKVLILLDDIDDKKQLDALAGERNWFMVGSLIIVTTRNEAVLDQSEFEVDYKYALNGLDTVHALLLFNRHAFRTNLSPKDFDGISRDIISTMGGLPLALEVVGSYLYKKKNGVWEDVRKQLENEPHRDVQKILRISYDALEDGQKKIFLDIVCFFICNMSELRESAKYEWEETSKCAMYMWEDCGFYPSQAIEELKLRCLIKITEDGMFEMHDQLRDLGRSIFCQGQSLELEKRTGPWDNDYKGVRRVIRHTEGLPSCVDDILRAAAASGTSNDELLYEVRWLEWQLFGSNPYLPPFNLHLPKLSVLKLGGYSFTSDWKRWNSFMASKRLKILVLSYYLYLRSTPDLSAFTQLKILKLRDCFELEHLHPSIGKLTSLVSLDLTNCRSLKKLPQEVGKLKGLEELLLSGTSITEIPTFIGSLRNLKKLEIWNGKSLREIPSSIGDLQNLQHLDLRFSEIEKLPSEIGDLPSLQTLNIDGTRISDLPESIRNLSSLQSLQLDGCTKLCSLPELPSGLTNLTVRCQSPTFCSLPELPLGLTNLTVRCQSPTLPQLSSLIHLKDLWLDHCHLLEDIPELSSTLLKLQIEKCDKLKLLKLDRFEYLEVFYMTGCSSIERLDLSCLNHLKTLLVRDCNNLVEIQGPDRAKFLEPLDVMGCKSMETLPDVNGCQNGCQRLEAVIVVNCKKLTQLRGFEKLDIIMLHTRDCYSLDRTGLFDSYDRQRSFYS